MNQRTEAGFPPGRLLVGAIVAVAVAVALVAWLLLKGDDGNEAARPERASVQELKALARSVGHPVYWAGKKRNFTYELTQTRDGSIYIRYLPPGVAIGDSRPNFLTVSTYPSRNAFATLRKAAKRSGMISERIPGVGLAVTDLRRPTSVYFARRGSDVQVELYDRSADRAHRLVLSGRVVPIR